MKKYAVGYLSKQGFFYIDFISAYSKQEAMGIILNRDSDRTQIIAREIPSDEKSFTSIH